MGGKNAVHIGIGLFDALNDGRLTHHAAAQENFLARMAALGMRQRADVAENALLGMLADGAGVQNDHVRALLGVGHAVAGGLQHTADAFGIGLVLLAAVGIDKGHGRDALRGPEFFDLTAKLRLKAKLLGRNDSGFCFQMKILRKVIFQHFILPFFRL